MNIQGGNTMKKVFVLFLFALMSMILMACGGEGGTRKKQRQTSQKLLVMT